MDSEVRGIRNFGILFILLSSLVTFHTTFTFVVGAPIVDPLEDSYKASISEETREGLRKLGELLKSGEMKMPEPTLENRTMAFFTILLMGYSTDLKVMFYSAISPICLISSPWKDLPSKFLPGWPTEGLKRGLICLGSPLLYLQGLYNSVRMSVDGLPDRRDRISLHRAIVSPIFSPVELLSITVFSFVSILICLFSLWFLFYALPEEILLSLGLLSKRRFRKYDYFFTGIPHVVMWFSAWGLLLFLVSGFLEAFPTYCLEYLIWNQSLDLQYKVGLSYLVITPPLTLLISHYWWNRIGSRIIEKHFK